MLEKEYAALKNEKAALNKEHSIINKQQTDELASLRQQIARQNEQNTTLRQQIAKQIAENNSLKSSQETLRQQISSQNEQNIALKGSQETLRQQIAKQNVENAALKSEQETLRQQITKQIAENSALKNYRESLRQQIAKQNVENAALKSSQEALRQQVAKQKELNSALKTEQNALNHRLVLLQTRQKDEKTSAAAEFQGKYAAQEKKYSELLAKSQESDRKLEELRKQNELINKQLSDSAEKIIANAKEAELSKQQIAQAQRNLAQNSDTLANMKARMLQYQEVMAANEKQRQDQLGEISKLKNTLHATAAERDQLVKELENIRKKLPSAEELELVKAEKAKAMQDIAQKDREKNALESNIAKLQAKLGDTQSKLEKNQKTLAVYRGDVNRLHAALQDFEKTKGQLENVQKESRNLRNERSTILKNAAVMEQNLKAELQKNARQILALRDENTRSRESIQTLTAKQVSLEKDLSRSAAQITDLKKQLAKALSEEERAKLKKRIEDMTESMRKLASGSEDELVREAASKNVVISDLLKEQENWKAEVRKMNKSVEAYRILAMRQREIAEKAEKASQVAVYDAKKTRGQLKMLQADIVDGVVQVPESRRLALANRKYQQEKTSADPLQTMQINASKEAKTPAKGKAVVKVGAPKENIKTAAAPAALSAALPKEYHAAMKRGSDAEKAGDFGMALWHYWQAADIAEKQPDPYMALAKLHVKRKEFDSALKAYQKAVLNGGKRDLELEREINK